ncbi:MAG: hypothetical protein ACK5WR_17305 [Planctomycetaceae bacterium]
MPRLLVLLAALLLLTEASVQAQESPPVKELILPGESFLVDKRPAFILWPAADKRQKPQPWVCYSPTLPGLPDQHEKWMHEKFLAAGIAVAGIDVGEGHGSPEARALFSKLYEELTERRGFAKRMVLLGRSRGGCGTPPGLSRTPTRSPGLRGSTRSSTCGAIPSSKRPPRRTS